MTTYHCKESCNKCRAENGIKVIDTTDDYVSECETKCRECGHEDYWAYGFFQSGSEMESKCAMYTVDT